MKWGKRSGVFHLIKDIDYNGESKMKEKRKKKTIEKRKKKFKKKLFIV